MFTQPSQLLTSRVPITRSGSLADLHGRTLRMDANQSPLGDGTDLQAERDALRIQVAAVAAQQARLLDEENQLQQRRSALEQREQQIAEHLEERQQRLVQLRDEIKQQRGALEEERRTFDD